MAKAVSKKDTTLTWANAAETPVFREAPHNTDAEQGLLGAILVNNDALHHINTNVRPEHFYAPVHQRIFGALQSYFDKGLIGSPVTLKHHFDQDEGLKELGGGAYLARLAASASTIINVQDYSNMIYDLALKRQLIGIGEEVVNVAYKSDLDLDSTTQIENAEQKLFHLASEGTAEKSFRSLKHSMLESIERINHALKNSGDVTGVPTRLTDMDKLLGGMHNSDLIILAGRPSMGKTALATSIAQYASEFFHNEERTAGTKPKSVGFFSLEMSAEQLASRLLAGSTGFSSGKLRKGELTPDEFAVLVRESNRMSQLPFHIDDTPALSIAALRARARRLKRVHNLGLLVVDYLQLVRGTSASLAQNNRVQEVSEITQGIKAIAKELNIPVLALSQLSRAVEQREDKRPQLSDLRESGSIEQDSDVVMFVFREEYYLMRQMPREDSPKMPEWQAEMEKVHGIAEIIVAKHRNGPVGTVALQFQSDITKFSDLAQGVYVPQSRD